jgi:hypothetical protein
LQPSRNALPPRLADVFLLTSLDRLAEPDLAASLRVCSGTRFLLCRRELHVGIRSEVCHRVSTLTSSSCLQRWMNAIETVRQLAHWQRIAPRCMKKSSGSACVPSLYLFMEKIHRVECATKRLARTSTRQPCRSNSRRLLLCFVGPRGSALL